MTRYKYEITISIGGDIPTWEGENDRETLIQVPDALGRVTLHTIHIRSVRIVNGELHTQEQDRLHVERTAANKAAIAALEAAA